MKKKKILSLLFCIFTFIVSFAALIIITLRKAYSKNIIGGISMPTIIFTFRQVLSSPIGIVLSAIIVISLITSLIVILKRKH